MRHGWSVDGLGVDEVGASRVYPSRLLKFQPTCKNLFA